jgi:hypothetical protein
MQSVSQNRVLQMVLLPSLLALLLLAVTISFAAESRTTKSFTGVKVNGGTATFAKSNPKRTLTLSDDFKVPETPAPHWQVVDSKGNVYLLQRLVIKGDKFNKTITVPPYVRDIAKVQIWCAFAETLLGEAPFAKPVK